MLWLLPHVKPNQDCVPSISLSLCTLCVCVCVLLKGVHTRSPSGASVVKTYEDLLGVGGWRCDGCMREFRLMLGRLWTEAYLDTRILGHSLYWWKIFGPRRWLTADAYSLIATCILYIKLYCLRTRCKGCVCVLNMLCVIWRWASVYVCFSMCERHIFIRLFVLSIDVWT